MLTCLLCHDGPVTAAFAISGSCDTLFHKMTTKACVNKPSGHVLNGDPKMASVRPALRIQRSKVLTLKLRSMDYCITKYYRSEGLPIVDGPTRFNAFQ